MKSNKIIYQVLFDNNVLRGNPLSKEVKRFIKNWSINKQLIINFYVPEIVAEEYKKYFLNEVKRSIKQVSGASELLYRFTGLKTNNPTLNDREILKIAEKTLQENALHIIPVPYDEVDLRDLAKKAVYYLPPFEEKHEKGFKDSLIAETIISQKELIPQETNLIFICGDNKLREYLSGNRKIKGGLKLYQSVPEFESELRLLLTAFDKHFIDRLTQQAKERFYNPAKPEGSLYYEFKVKEKISEQYGYLFVHPERHRRLEYLSNAYFGESETGIWVAVEQPLFEIGNPVFSQKRNGKYQWETTVVSKQRFEKISSMITLGSNYFLEHILEFNIKWEFELDKDHKIIKSILKDIKHTSALSNEIYEYPGISHFSQPTPVSGVTISGIGTVPVNNQGQLKPVSYGTNLGDFLSEKDK